MGNRPIMVGRELTKVHQEFLYGTCEDVAGRLTAPRGEFTVVIGPRPPEAPRAIDLSDGQVAAEFGKETEIAGSSRRAAVLAVARRLGRSTREVYAAVERAKQSGE